MRYHDEQYLDEGMGTIFCHQKLVRTRKPHPCDPCGHVLPVGSRLYKYWVMTTEDDKPRGFYMCQTNAVQGYCKHEAQVAQAKYNAEHTHDRLEPEQ